MDRHDSTPGRQWNEPPNSSALPVEWVQRLWDRMATMFGQKFTSQFHGHDDNLAWLETWGLGLADKSAADLKLGIARMLRECSWPPSLPEFRRLCEPERVRPEHQRLLPEPRDTKDRSAEIAALLAKVQAGAKRDHNYSWTLRLNKQSAVDYIWRDKDCVDLHRYMIENGVVDENGKLTPEQIARQG